MLIRLGYDIQFEIPTTVAMVGMLHVHPSRAADLREPDEVTVSPDVTVDVYIDSYGNRCARWLASAGPLRLTGSTLIEDPGTPDEIDPDAQEHPVNELPPETLRYLLNSRYCEVDRLSNIAVELFGHLKPGWSRVQAICGWVNWKVAFGYHHARSSKTALDVFHRADRSLPRLPASGGHFLPGAQHSSPLRDGISGRHRRAETTDADGFQRLV
jgi:transglutaminase-like putative cysteine protease